MLFDFIKRFWLINPTMYLFPPIGGGSATKYSIANSLRCRASNSAYLTRTPATTTDRTTWTLSMWVKRGAISTGTRQCLFGVGNSGAGASSASLYFDYANSSLDFHDGGSVLRSSVRQFRDPIGHFHLQIVADTNNATAANRLRFYINSQEITSWNTNVTISAGYTFQINRNIIHCFGRNPESSQFYFDGEISDIHFVDGQALSTTTFCEFDSNGVWVPKKYTGTYGTNGSYLPFNVGTSLTTLGQDRSGNGNNWTLNNFSLTAGVTYDWMTDTPTNNYATLNPLSKATSIAATDGNLRSQWVSAANGHMPATMALPASGAYYWEWTSANTSNGNAGYQMGLMQPSRSLTAAYDAAGSYHFYVSNIGYLVSNGSILSSSLSAMSAGEVFKFAADVTNNKFWIGRGSIWYDSSGGTTGNPSTGANPTFSGGIVADLLPYFGIDATSTVSGAANFGQQHFAYTPPTGFKALCTANLPAVAIPNPKKHFDVRTRAGNGGTQNLTGLGFGPGFHWGKRRDTAGQHVLTDIVRGANKQLFTALTSAEQTDATNFVTSFNSDGITLGPSGGATGDLNASGGSYVDWLWKAGGTAVSNTAGSITSQVSANVEAGFSIVTYTGTGANATVGHGLGKQAKLVITKGRGAADSWFVYHANLISPLYYLQLHSTIAQTNNAAVWNTTSPTASTFSVGTNTGINGAGKTYVAYCFADIPGYSKISSYVGDGSTDGRFVDCGFKPRWLLIKRVDTGGFSWLIHDTARDADNPNDLPLYPDLSNAEVASNFVDIVANGFKLRNLGGGWNANGGTYIFVAFAEHPFGGSNVAPAPAR